MQIAEKIFSYPLLKLVWYRLRLTLPLKRPQVPAHDGGFRTISWGTGNGQNGTQDIPRTIWSYWNGKSSECAEACRKTWNEHQNGFTIHVLSGETIRDFLPDFPDLPEGIPEQKVSNLARLMLLERHGGIWMDYSTILTRPLDWIIKLLDANDCEMLAFYNEFPDEYATDHARPIIENGFLAARAESKFISDWRRTYQDCIQSRDYKEYFRNLENFDDLTSNFLNKGKDHLDYFVCYIAAQHVMLNSNSYRLFLINAEDEYYYYSYSMTPPRSKRKFAEELLLRSVDGNARSRLIKITGRHRAAIDEHIKYGCYRSDSIIGQCLARQLRK